MAILLIWARSRKSARRRSIRPCGRTPCWERKSAILRKHPPTEQYPVAQNRNTRKFSGVQWGRNDFRDGSPCIELSAPAARVIGGEDAGDNAP